MKVKDCAQLFGEVEVILTDAKTGKVLYYEKGRNLVVNQGKEYMKRNIIKDTTTYDGSYLVLSTSTADPSASETSMPATVISPAKTATKSIVEEGGVNYCQWTATWETNEANNTIGSVGICENSDGSGLWARYKFSTAITKDNTMRLTINYRIGIN